MRLSDRIINFEGPYGFVKMEHTSYYMKGGDFEVESIFGVHTYA